MTGGAGDDAGTDMDEVAPVDDGSDGAHALLTNARRLGLADGRDVAADERDAAADERDEVADARDAHADVRDEAAADLPDPAGTRRFAAQDRGSAADNREAAAEDRQEARDDREASRWDRTVAEQIKAHLLLALDDAETLPKAIELIGRAQTMLMDTFGGTGAEALIEIADRADRDEIGMQEAARRIMSDGAPSNISGIRTPEL